jgi:hypothetical protein
MAESASKRVRQSASLSTTTFDRAASSEGRNVRPAIALTPRTSKNPAVTHWRVMVSAVPSLPFMTMPPMLGMNPAINSKVRLRSFQSAMLRGETALRDERSVRSQIITRRSGSGKGKARSKAASTRAKMALLAPMPSASVVTATSAKAGARLSCRSEKVRSCRNSSKPWVRRMLVLRT